MSGRFKPRRAHMHPCAAKDCPWRFPCFGTTLHGEFCVDHAEMQADHVLFGAPPVERAT